MSMVPPKSVAPPRKLAWMAVAAVYYLGITAVVGWSFPQAGVAGQRADPAAGLPRGEISHAGLETPAPLRAERGARRKANCDGCGVIESMRRIDTREEVMHGCAIGDTPGMRIPGTPIAGDDRRDLASLADMVFGMIGGERRAKNTRLTTRHQIVVRFPDGTRHVFNEDSPRSLREGDRILVITGSTGSKG